MARHFLPALALAGLALLPSPANAQRRHIERIRQYFDGSGGLQVGLIGGPNLNTVTGAGPVDSKIRGMLGAYLSVPVEGVLRFRPEVIVSGKQVGFDELTPPPCPLTGCLEQVASFTWLEAPMLLETQFHRALGGWGTPRLYAGPFVAIRLGCSFATPVAATPALSGTTHLVQSCNSSEATATRYNNGDAGFVLGGGIGVRGVGVGFRWTRSLVAVAPDQTVATDGRLIGAKHSSLAVTFEIGARIR